VWLKINLLTVSPDLRALYSQAYLNSGRVPAKTSAIVISEAGDLFIVFAETYEVVTKYGLYHIDLLGERNLITIRSILAPNPPAILAGTLYA